MRDLDYDELDRAVNSVITNTPEPTSDNVNVVAETPPSRTNENNSLNISLAGRRSAGRFMDVVRPVQDRPASATVAQPVSREAATVNPISSEPVVAEPVTVTESVVKQEVPVSERTWPDPIDFHESMNKMNDQAAKPNEKNEDADIDQINDEITNELSQQSSESPETPFLPGAKVEKRPLGAFSDESLIPNVESPMHAESAFEKSDTIGSDVNINTPLPPELQDDLLAIESDSTTHPEMIDTTDKVITNVAKILDNTQPVASGEIAQQYKEQPSSGDQKTGAIYDTNDYHKAPLQPVKKKSGWMWVVWIVLLLLVGAGAGAAVYFFVLN